MLKLTHRKEQKKNLSFQAHVLRSLLLMCASLARKSTLRLPALALWLSNGVRSLREYGPKGGFYLLRIWQVALGTSFMMDTEALPVTFYTVRT